MGEKEKSVLGKKLVEAKAKRWNPEMESVYGKIEKKSEDLWKDGEYENYIDYLKEKLNELAEITKKGGTKSELVTSITSKINQYAERLKAEERSISNKISLYTDASVADMSYNKKIEREKERLGLSKKEILELELPETFTTKTGIKFTKILKKDGKPVYVSDRIRPDQADSWYFARDYAVNLNKEDNCPDCYRLPYREEIENLKADREYEGLWLQSWSPAYFGMTIGNLYLGFYTFDYVHDVVFHPLSWQSYLYPISPDSVYASRGGSWDDHARNIRSAYRSVTGRNASSVGFRLVRPLR